MSEKNSGEGNPFFGRKHGENFHVLRAGHSTSPEARVKMSKAKLGNKCALGHIWTQVGTPEQLAEWGRKGAEVLKKAATPEKRHDWARQGAVASLQSTTPEQRREWGKRATEVTTPEQRREWGKLAEHVLTPEQREQRRIGSAWGRHNRWHVSRGIVNPQCKLCAEPLPQPQELRTEAAQAQP